MIKTRLLLFIVFFLISLRVTGQANLLSMRKINEVNPTNYQIYIEKKERLNLHSLKRNDINELFDKNKNDLPKFKPTSFWFSRNTSKIELSSLLEIYAPNSTTVNAYKIEFDQEKVAEIEKVVTTKHRNDFHLLRIEKGSGLLLVNIKTNRYSHFTIKSFTEKAFFLKERKLNVYYGFIVGVFLLLALYHFVLYIKVLDRLYLYYILLILISGLLVAPHSGFIEITSFLYYDIFFVIFQVSCIIISVNYLNIQSRYKTQTWLIIIAILSINLVGIFTPSTALRYLSHSVGIFIYIGILLASLEQVKKSFKPAIWFLLPWASLFIAHLIYLFNFDLLFQYRQVIELGFLANICLLALAIGNKLNIYKDQKRFAESMELKALTERDRVIQEQNIILEQLINERNKKILERNTTLSEKKIEIEKNNELIKETNQRLRIINHELLNKNSEISAQNQELKKHHELLEIIVNKRTKKLLAAKERAIVADKLKTSFLNNLTQEIRTPMNAITGYANLLNGKNLTKEKRNNYLAHINKNVDVLLESIDNVVILARIQARILKPKLKQFKLLDLIINFDEIFNEKLKTLGKKDILLKINEINISEVTIIYSDYEKLWQIIYRLVDNSIKFTENGQVLISYELKVINQEQDQYIFIFQIKDTGIGIEKEKLDFILERFSNIEDDKTKLYRGAGIGLAIVKGLVDILQGKIIIHSKAEKGTSFKIEIPVLIDTSANQGYQFT